MNQKPVVTKEETVRGEEPENVLAPPEKIALTGDEGEGRLAAALANANFSSRLQLR